MLAGVVHQPLDLALGEVVETISGEGTCRGSGVACFKLPPLEKIIGGVTSIVSFPPGGWMQQSAEPAVKRREFITLTRRRGGMAARGARAAADNAGDRVPQQRIA